MTELQERLIDMMKEFHDICIRENLRYYLLGGTALGAARHQGFIPWDDDIDVGMPRKDYERLKALSFKTNFGKYHFEYPSNDKSFVYPYGKMYDTTTTYVENTRYRTKRGVYIDIFPLDGAGNTYEESLTNFRNIDKKINLLSSKSCGWRKGRKLYKNMALLVMRLVPEFIVSQNFLKSEINKISSRIDFDKSTYIANYCGNWHEKEISERDWFGKPTLYEFNGIQVFGPQNIDAYLAKMYGDWRTPPPKEKQVTHHDYLFIDLNSSYLD